MFNNILNMDNDSGFTDIELNDSEKISNQVNGISTTTESNGVKPGGAVQSETVTKHKKKKPNIVSRVRNAMVKGLEDFYYK